MQEKHTCFNECCRDAMDYVDNFDMSSVSSQEDQPKEMHEPGRELESNAKELNIEKIIDIVVRMMEQLYHPPITYQPESTNMPMRKRCQLCKLNFMHTTQEGHHIPKMLQEQARTRTLEKPRAQVMKSERPLVSTQTQEHARPILLAQPLVHGIAPSMANQGNLEKAKGGTKPMQVGPCMECGGDHWIKYFPHRKQPVKIKQMRQMKHFRLL